MSYFSNEISKLLYNSQTLFKFHEDNKAVIKYGLNIFQNSTLNIFKLTQDQKDLFDRININTYFIKRKLTEKVEDGGVTRKVGYNFGAIQGNESSTFTDYSLINASTSLTNLYSDFITIFNDYNGSFDHYKLMHFLYSDDLTHLLELSDYQRGTDIFQYIHNLEAYMGKDYNDYSGISLLYCYVTLYKLYQLGYNYERQFIVDCFNNDTYSASRIVSEFDDYIDTNVSNMSDMLFNFYNNNVLQLGGSLSETFKTAIKSELQTLISELKPIFLTFATDNIQNDRILQLITNTFTSSCRYSSIHYLYNVNPDIPTDKSFYDYCGSIFDIDSYLNKYNFDEDYIANYLLDYLDTHQEELSNLEITSYKFKLNPLFYLNSLYVTYLKYSDSLVYTLGRNFEADSVLYNDIKNGYGFDTVVWRDMFQVDPSLSDSLKTYIETHPIQTTEELCKIEAFYYLKKIIGEFINTEEFKTWIYTRLVPVINDFIKNKFYLLPEFNVEKLDLIIMFFKFIFINDMNNDLLFNTFISDYASDYKNENDISNTVISNDLIEARMNYQFFPNSDVNLFNAIFKASVISRYFTNTLNDYKL